MAGSGTGSDKVPATASSTFLGPKQRQDPGDLKAAQQRRDAIRKTLIQEARDDFISVTQLAGTGYARETEQLQGELNGYLQRNLSSYKAYDGRVAVVLNQDDFDTAGALGMNAEDAIRRMLKKHDVTAPHAVISDLARNMGHIHSSKFGVYGYIPDAEVRENVGSQTGKKFYIMVPISNNISTNRVPGLSYTDNIDFINKHESWHIKDSWYDLSRFDKETLEAAGVGWAPEYLAETPEAQEAYSMVTRKEALADVAALGDMIRERKSNSYKLITTVAGWRESSPDDDVHISSPVLKGFRHEIEKMGHGNFLKLSEGDAQEFYHRVVEKYGLNPQAVKYAAEYESATGDDKKRLLAAAGADPDMKKALQFLELKNSKAAREAAAEPEADLKVQKEIDAYSPRKALLDRAFELRGKITPKTLIEAHREMEEELRQKAVSEPRNPLYPLQMAKLQKAFIDAVQFTDYEVVNWEEPRRVRLVDVEPSLAKFVSPPASEESAVPAPGDVSRAAPSTAKKTPKPAPG